MVATSPSTSPAPSCCHAHSSTTRGPSSYVANVRASAACAVRRSSSLVRYRRSTARRCGSVAKTSRPEWVTRPASAASTSGDHTAFGTDSPPPATSPRLSRSSGSVRPRRAAHSARIESRTSPGRSRSKSPSYRSSTSPSSSSSTDEVRPAAIDLRETDRQRGTLGLLLVGDTPAQIDLRPGHTSRLAESSELRKHPLDQFFPLCLHVAKGRRHEHANRPERIRLSAWAVHGLLQGSRR